MPHSISSCLYLLLRCDPVHVALLYDSSNMKGEKVWKRVLMMGAVEAAGREGQYELIHLTVGSGYLNKLASDSVMTHILSEILGLRVS